MEHRKQFDRLMKETMNMALATSVDGQPNVRVVTFAYDEGQPGRVYFTSFKGNQKVKEFEQNHQVACLPLPENNETDAQVRIFGRVQKSARSLEEIVALIALKSQGNATTIMEGGDMLELFEVAFDEAMVTVGMTEAQAVTF